MDEYLDFARDIVYKAGEIMIKYFSEDNHSTYKYKENAMILLL